LHLYLAYQKSKKRPVYRKYCFNFFGSYEETNEFVGQKICLLICMAKNLMGFVGTE
jgi:hypothetical protein